MSLPVHARQALTTTREFLSREQVAALAGVSLATVNRAIRSGALAYDAEVIGRLCFTRAAAEAYAKSKVRTLAPAPGGAS